MPFPPGAPMHPWYNGFRGTIQEAPSKTAGRSYVVYGTIAQVRAQDSLPYHDSVPPVNRRCSSLPTTTYLLSTAWKDSA